MKDNSQTVNKINQIITEISNLEYDYSLQYHRLLNMNALRKLKIQFEELSKIHAQSFEANQFLSLHILHTETLSMYFEELKASETHKDCEEWIRILSRIKNE